MRGSSDVSMESGEQPSDVVTPLHHNQQQAHPHHQANNKTVSPPLSAAASQASLSGSEGAVSDPDSASVSAVQSSSVSLTSSSRPSSSASGLVSPDNHPITDITDALEEDAAESVSDDLTNDDTNSAAPVSVVRNTSSELVDNSLLDPSLLVSSSLKSTLAAETTNSDVEEEYFEEYHLPNTHENAFVRHRSFRRKVELTPINAPDAEKIEGLVRTGEFERHGSIRRKMVPNGVDDKPLYKVDEEINDQPKVSEFSEDFKEIEMLMDDPNNPELQNGLQFDTENGPSKSSHDVDTPKLFMRTSINTSTPNAPTYASTADYASIDANEMESIEQSTMNKIQECMDFSRCKDIYSLTGKLQDILTAVEVEEVLNNSHKYTDYIDSGVLEALFNSYTEQMSFSGQPVSISFSKPDVNKPKNENKPRTSEEIELEKKIKEKLLMEELAMDSLPYNVNNNNSNGNNEEVVVVMRQKNTDGGEGSRFSTFERRKSIRLKNADQAPTEVEGVFLESDFQDSKLKKLTAPSIDLENSGSQDDLDIPDYEPEEPIARATALNSYEQPLSLIGSEQPLSLMGSSQPLSMTDVPNPLSDSYSNVPSIKVTRSDSTREEDNSSTNNLFMDESGCSDEVSNQPIQTCRPSRVSQDSTFDQICSAEGEEDIPYLPQEEDQPEPRSLLEQYTSDPPSAAFPPQLPVHEDSEGEERHWRNVVIGGAWRRIDMAVIAPYLKCICPGGSHNGHAVVVVSACQLPERSRKDYNYVMDNLFLYLLSRLEQLVTEDYILVYLSGGVNVANTGPGFHWLKAAYQSIDRKLRKNLQALLVVHPTLWVRTIVALTRPFISSKFYRKLTFVYSLTELAQLLPLEQLNIPESVTEADFALMSREKKRNVSKRPVPAVFTR